VGHSRRALVNPSGSAMLSLETLLLCLNAKTLKTSAQLCGDGVTQVTNASGQAGTPQKRHVRSVIEDWRSVGRRRHVLRKLSRANGVLVRGVAAELFSEEKPRCYQAALLSNRRVCVNRFE
jgi:hypothetical protein